MDAVGYLVEAMEARIASVEEAARVALEAQIPDRPLLTIVVCVECGAHEPARA
jgi:hypothetical protein